MSRPALGYLTVALLIVYGMVLPNALTNSVSAHNLGWNLVRDGHLKYFNQMSDSEVPGGDFSELIELAEDEWDPMSAFPSAKSSERVTLTSGLRASARPRTIHSEKPIQVE